MALVYDIGVWRVWCIVLELMFGVGVVYGMYDDYVNVDGFGDGVFDFVC